MSDMLEEPSGQESAKYYAQQGGRPLNDVLKDIFAGLKLKSTAQQAAEHLRQLVKTNEQEVLQSHAISMLGSIIKESPGLPVGGTAMNILSSLTMTPAGRVRVRADAGIAPVVRFLSTAEATQPNTEAGARLLMTLAPDKHARRHICKDGGVEALVKLLKQRPQGVTAACVAGALANLVVTDDVDAKQRFVAAGGIEAACKVCGVVGMHGGLLHALYFPFVQQRQALSERPRELSATNMRLRLLLSELSRLKDYEAQVRDAAADCAVPTSLDRTATAPAADAAVLKAEAAAVLEGAQQEAQSPRISAAAHDTDHMDSASL